MKNPWEKIYKDVRSGEKFIVAEADRPYIEEFLNNKKYVPKEEHKLHFNMMKIILTNIYMQTDMKILSKTI